MFVLGRCCSSAFRYRSGLVPTLMTLNKSHLINIDTTLNTRMQILGDYSPLQQKMSTAYLSLFNMRSDATNDVNVMTESISAAMNNIITENDGIIKDSKIVAGFSAEEMDIIKDYLSKEVAEFEIQVCLEKGSEKGTLRLLKRTIQLVVQNIKLLDEPYSDSHWIHVGINIGKGRSQFILQPLNCLSSYTCETNGDTILRDMIVVIANAFVMKCVMFIEPEPHWIAPPKGWLKLNTYGDYYSRYEVGGIGGVIRDNYGNWLTGFWGKSTDATTKNLSVEALKIGLAIALEIKGARKVMIEIDHHTMDRDNELLEDSNFMINTDSSYHSLIFECRELLKEIGESNYKLQDTCENSNYLAEYLAEEGEELANMEVIRSDVPPKNLSLCLIESSGLPSHLW